MYVVKKDRTDPSVGCSRAPPVRANAVPAAMPPPRHTEAREEPALALSCALWATPVHDTRQLDGGVMVESTADDHLTVDGDGNRCAKQKVSAVSLGPWGSWTPAPEQSRHSVTCAECRDCSGP